MYQESRLLDEEVGLEPKFADLMGNLSKATLEIQSSNASTI